MTALQRIQASLGGQPVDRCAVAPLLSLYGAQLTACPLRTYYTDAAAYARAQSAVRSTFEPDILFGPFAFARFGEAFGGELHFLEQQAPNLKRPALGTAGDWDRLQWPDPDANPALLYFRQALRAMAQQHGDTVPIAACLPLPVDLPGLVLGAEQWLEVLLFEPERAREILTGMIDFYVALATRFFADGASLVCSTCSFASAAVLPASIVARLFLPCIQATIARVPGPVVLHHGGATLNPHLSLLSEIDRVPAFVLDERDDFLAARQVLGPSRVLLAGPSGPRLATTHPDEIGHFCRELLRLAADDRRFILCSSGPDIPLETPPACIHAVCQAAGQFAGGAR